MNPPIDVRLKSVMKALSDSLADGSPFAGTRTCGLLEFWLKNDDEKKRGAK